MHHQIDVACSPTLLWKVLSDISGWHRMSRYHGPARWIQGEPWVPGSKFRIEVRHPLRDTVECVVESGKAPETLAWTADGLGVRVLRKVTLTPHEGGSRVATTASIISGRVEWAIEPAIELFSTEWLQSIKDFVEDRPKAKVSGL